MPTVPPPNDYASVGNNQQTTIKEMQPYFPSPLKKMNCKHLKCMLPQKVQANDSCKSYVIKTNKKPNKQNKTQPTKKLTNKITPSLKQQTNLQH